MLLRARAGCGAWSGKFGWEFPRWGGVVGRRYSDMFDWDPEAPRAAQQCEADFKRRQRNLTAADEEARVRPERGFQRIMKRNPATNDHDHQAELLSSASMDSRAPRLAAKYADN
jgi:hypothetical protein